MHWVKIFKNRSLIDYISIRLKTVNSMYTFKLISRSSHGMSIDFEWNWCNCGENLIRPPAIIPPRANSASAIVNCAMSLLLGELAAGADVRYPLGLHLAKNFRMFLFHFCWMAFVFVVLAVIFIVVAPAAILVPKRCPNNDRRHCGTRGCNIVKGVAGRHATRTCKAILNFSSPPLDSLPAVSHCVTAFALLYT